MLTLISLIMSILIGGVITGNILGDMKQKTAEVVFFIWKGIQVFRKRVVPFNPQSDDQKTQRAFFTAILRLGQDINTSIIKPFWKHLAVKKSEFNAFMSYNLLNMTSETDYPNLSLCRGSLYPTPISEATYNSMNGEFAVNFDTTTSGDQNINDIVYLAVYDKVNKFFMINISGTRSRGDGDIIIVKDTGLDPANYVAYLWFSDKAVTNPTFKASNSAYAQFVAF